MLNFLRAVITGKPWITTNRLFLWGHAGAYRCLPFVPWLGVIVIHPDYQHDKGLIAHEGRHKEHHRRWPFSFVHRVVLCHDFRLWTEVDAFVVQAMQYDDVDDRLVRFAGFIANNYGLDITEQQALDKLKKEYESVKMAAESAR